MIEAAIVPWQALKALMGEEYRKAVVAVALERLQYAGKPLRRFAVQALSTVRVPGFRSLSRVPANALQHHVVKEMPDNNLVAAAIVCLWADAQKEGAIADLAHLARGHGWQVRSDWSWEIARNGFLPPDGSPVVATLFEQISNEYGDREKDDLLLATLWLSEGLIESSEEPDDNAGSTKESNVESTSAVAVLDTTVTNDHTCAAPAFQGREDLQVKEDETIDAMMETVLGQGLEESIAGLRGDLDLEAEIKQSTIAAAQNLPSILKAGILPDAQQHITSIGCQLESWQIQRNKLQQRIRAVALSIAQELDTRLDLDPARTAYERINEISRSAEMTPGNVEVLFATAEQILLYDEQKDNLLKALEQTQAELIASLGALEAWGDDIALFEQRLVERETLKEATLLTIEKHLTTAKQSLQGLKKQLIQMAEASHNRIMAMASNTLQNSAVPFDGELTPGLRISDVSIQRLREFGPTDLLHLERVLAEIITHQMMEVKIPHSAEIAEELLHHWNPDLLHKLLQALAAESRDAETVLLILGSVAANPKSEDFSLDSQVVDSFLRGLNLFAEDSSPSKLFNLGVSTLLRGWRPKEEISIAKLCLHLMAAKYAGEYRLPSDFLWDVTTEWPFGHMSGWASLWQQALLEDAPPVIIDDEQTHETSELEQARQRCQQLFVREGGALVRLRSIKSRRHQAMLYDYLLPDFEDIWRQLQDIESGMKHASEAHEITRQMRSLETLVRGQIEPLMSDESLIKAYEHAVYKADVQDKDPFHRRTTLRVLREYVQILAEFAETLSAHFEIGIQQQDSLSRTALIAELSSQSDLVALGQTVIGELMQCGRAEKLEWLGEKAEQDLHQYVLSTLLTQAAYARRLPRVVGYLVANAIIWAEMLPFLLQDLTQPTEAEQAVLILLEKRAPNQALLLAQQIPLELHKQIQNLRSREEKQLVALTEDLSKDGGNVDDLAENRRLGRWPLLVKTVEERLNIRQVEATQGMVRIQKQARELLKAINDLEFEIVERRSSMPVQAYELIGQGLNAARDMVRQSQSFQEVRDYLSETRYRIDHDSWSGTDLQQMLGELHGVSDGKKRGQSSLDAKAVLDAFQQENLSAIGLSGISIASSEIDTRVDLLQSWLNAREMPSFLSDGLTRIQRDKIRKLFSAFALMTAMARRRSPIGDPLIFEEPTVYEYWALKYPKASALTQDCILVSLPGAPPSPQYLKELDNIIDDREWMTYEFVFLFAPGLTEPLRERLQQKYQDRGLVVIDEQTLLTMVLAGPEGRTPLGRLRAMMLNAYGAQSVDVFKVNPSVDERTGIFVGRDYSVRKIAGSGENYALYGGRRIGKSSIMGAVENLLKSRDWVVVADSFEGRRDFSDDAIARTLASKLPFEIRVQTIEDLRIGLEHYLESHADAHVVFLLDEIDPYIRANPERHVLIETFRAITEHCSGRFRVIVAGFLYLHSCLQGRGPYSPSSDPWRRMFTPTRVDNLPAGSAEKIVTEGFLEVLGWDFENRAVARWIVERTSGHPAFVQYFCMKLKEIVAERKDRCVRLQDIRDVFEDNTPESSFISYVQQTLELNLEPPEGTIGRYIILWLANESKEMQGFTFAQAQEIAHLSDVEIPDDYLKRALERLKVTSVVDERSAGVFDFSVPDYPLILNRLGGTAHLAELESELKKWFGG